MRRRCLLLLLLAATAPAQTPPKAVLDGLTTKIDVLLARDPPPLYAWHLRSLRALAQEEYLKLALARPQSLARPVALREKEFVEYAAAIDKGLGDGPDAFLKDGRRALVLARLTNIDGTLQAMTVDLPKGWDPGRAYPLFVGLHGSGPDNPLAYPSFAATPHEPGGGPTGDMVRLAPWGRGNRGWRGDAEDDLFEAIRTLESFARLDPDRWYLTGHSSGADGVWAILQHTPDLWAAAGPQSGSMVSGLPEWGLVPNQATVPTYLVIGADDNLPRRVPDNKEAFRLLKSLGGEAELAVLPGVGHYPLPGAALDAQARWMVGHVLKRPDRFVFTVDQAKHPGVWGVTVVLDAYSSRLVKEPWPRFACEIKGGDVRVKTESVKELRIDFGPRGLRMAGNVRLWVDGKKAYEGPAPEKPMEIKVGK